MRRIALAVAQGGLGGFEAEPLPLEFGEEGETEIHIFQRVPLQQAAPGRTLSKR